MSEFLLEARGVTKTFTQPTGDLSILSDVNFSIRAGTSVAVYGDSGCGKTTFLNVLALLDTPDGGEIFWEGCSMRGRSISELARLRARYIGFVFQSYYLVPELNVLENVLLPARFLAQSTSLLKPRALQLLKGVGLGEKCNQLPERLSGGERQRVAIARALINEPKLILADEPTGNLDEKNGLEVLELLCGLCRDHATGLLIVTHNPGFTKRTECSFRLHQGHLS